MALALKKLNETIIDYSHIYIMFPLYLDSVSLFLHITSKTVSSFQYDDTNVQAFSRESRSRCIDTALEKQKHFINDPLIY